MADRSLPSCGEVPHPEGARTLDEVIDCLRRLKSWSGDLSYAAIASRINAMWRLADRPERTAKSTVADCFANGRSRVDEELLLAVVWVLHPDPEALDAWQQALRRVRGETAAARSVQAQATLPAPIDVFTGRASELATLTAWGRGVAVIEGMAGVGKTQLAIRAGHELLTGGGVDQVLFVNLRGFNPDPTQPPADPQAVLVRFLRLLGVPGDQIPPDLEQQAVMYQRRLAGLRALLVLDNAASDEQVRPLLPGNTASVTLITTRRAFRHLPGCRRMPLAVFTPSEGIDYLRRTTNVEAVESHRSVAAQICQVAGHLPLALHLAAARIATRPHWTLADHLDRLVTRRRDLRLEDGIELSISLSYDSLDADQRRLLRMVSLHPGQDFEAHAAGALAGMDPAVAADTLQDLLAEHLLTRNSRGRYEIHDLIRAHATARGQDEDRPGERQAALTRLHDHYLHTAHTAVELLYPHDRRPSLPPSAAAAAPLVHDSAAGWLDTERDNLLAVATSAVCRDRPNAAVLISGTVHRYLFSCGHYREAESLHRLAAATAARLGDQLHHANALTNLASVCARTGQHGEGTDHLREALSVFSALGDRRGQARALCNLGALSNRRCQYAQATTYLRQALSLLADMDDRFAEAHTLIALSLVCLLRGHVDEAVRHLQRAWNLSTALGDRSLQAKTLINLGLASAKTGQPEQAIAQQRHAFTLATSVADPYGQGHALTNLGGVYATTSQYEQAIDHHRRALAIFRDVADPAGQADALNGLGETYRAAGDYRRAMACHTDGHRFAASIGSRYEQARAMAGMGLAHCRLGDHHQARQCWQRALRHYEELGVPEADEVRARLAPSTT